MFQSIDLVFDTYDEIDTYNSCGFNFSKNFEHLCFANFDINTDGGIVPDLRSYKVNPYKLGLNGKFKTDIFPPNSMFFMTEFQNYAPSNMDQYIRPEYRQFFQTSRHYGLSIFVDTQRPTDVAKCIRDLFDVFIECVSVENLYYNGVCIGHKWKLRIIENSRFLEDYLKSNDNKLCVEIYHKSDRCYFNNYNSEFCRDLHIRGRENQDFKIEHFGNGGDDDILSQPDGFFIKKSDRANSFEEDCEVLF